MSEAEPVGEDEVGMRLQCYRDASQIMGKKQNNEMRLGSNRSGAGG